MKTVRGKSPPWENSSLGTNNSRWQLSRRVVARGRSLKYPSDALMNPFPSRVMVRLSSPRAASAGVREVISGAGLGNWTSSTPLSSTSGEDDFQ